MSQSPEDKARAYWKRLESTVAPRIKDMVPLKVNLWVDKEGYAHFAGIFASIKNDKVVFLGIHYAPGVDVSKTFDIGDANQKAQLAKLEALIRSTTVQCKNQPLCKSQSGGCVQCSSFPQLFPAWFDAQPDNKATFLDLTTSTEAFKLLDKIRS